MNTITPRNAVTCCSRATQSLAAAGSWRRSQAGRVTRQQCPALTRGRELRGAAGAPQLRGHLLRLRLLALGREVDRALGAAKHACVRGGRGLIDSPDTLSLGPWGIDLTHTATFVSPCKQLQQHAAIANKASHSQQGWRRQLTQEQDNGGCDCHHEHVAPGLHGQRHVDQQRA